MVSKFFSLYRLRTLLLTISNLNRLLLLHSFFRLGNLGVSDSDDFGNNRPNRWRRNQCFCHFRNILHRLIHPYSLSVVTASSLLLFIGLLLKILVTIRRMHVLIGITVAISKILTINRLNTTGLLWNRFLWKFNYFGVLLFIPLFWQLCWNLLKMKISRPRTVGPLWRLSYLSNRQFILIRKLYAFLEQNLWFIRFILRFFQRNLLATATLIKRILSFFFDQFQMFILNLPLTLTAMLLLYINLSTSIRRKGRLILIIYLIIRNLKLPLSVKINLQ